MALRLTVIGDCGVGLFENGGSMETHKYFFQLESKKYKRIHIAKCALPDMTSKDIGGPVGVRHGFSLEKASTNISETIFIVKATS